MGSSFSRLTRFRPERSPEKEGRRRAMSYAMSYETTQVRFRLSGGHFFFSLPSRSETKSNAFASFA